MKTREKRYPFSVQKHAHDIEFRRNRVANSIDDMCYGEIEWDEDEFDRLEKLRDALDDLMLAVMNGDGRVAWLTGSLFGLAKETVEWARMTRAGSMIRNGKTEYLQYV